MHGLANLTSQIWQMASALNSRNIKVMLNWSEGKRSGQCLRCCICRFKIYSLLGFVFPKLLCWWPTGHLFTVKFLYAEHCVHLNRNFHLKKPLRMNEWMNKMECQTTVESCAKFYEICCHISLRRIFAAHAVKQTSGVLF